MESTFDYNDFINYDELNPNKNKPKHILPKYERGETMTKYKPAMLKSNFRRGPSGIANVEISPDKSKVRISYKEVGDKYVLSINDCPEGIRKGTWFVTLTEDKSKVLNLRPANGVFKAKVISFPAPENQPPTPRIKTGSYEGKSFEYQYFIAIITLLNSEVKGMEVPVILRYHFGKAEEDGKDVVAFSHPKSKYTPQLVEFCEVTGMWNKGMMPYKDNILPLMEKRILHEDKTFQVVIKNGYADSFMELDNSTSTAEETDDDEFVPEAEELADED